MIGRRPLRPSWEERRQAIERAREGVLDRQGAAARRRDRVRRATPLAMLAALGLGLALGGPLARRGAAARPDLFAVRQLAVVGAERLSPAEVARAAGLAAGAAWSEDAAQAIAARVAAHPWIASAHAARVAPDTVVVRVVEHRPAAVLERPGAEPLLVGRDGTPFAPAGPPDEPAAARPTLPQLRLGAPVELDRPDPRLAEGIAVARAAAAAGWSDAVVELDGPDPHALPALRVSGLAPRLVLGAGEAPAKLDRLARVLAEVPESRGALEIDLRFAEQAVLRPVPPEPDVDGEAVGADAPPPSTGDRSG